MQTIIDRLLLLVGGCFLIDANTDIKITLSAVLIAMTISEFNLAFDRKRLYNISIFGYMIVCVIEPTFIIFLPLLLYDALKKNLIPNLLGGCMLILYYLMEIGTLQRLLMLFLIALLYVLQYRTKRLEELETELKQLKDTSTELGLVMEARNREIQTNQDNQVHLATLTERNRIAREIHDNVGHMLSRSILMVGAFLAMNKEESMNDNLMELKTTLSKAMSSIRDSVHGLYDDSIDLHVAVKTIMSEFTFCEAVLDFDMSKKVEGKVKLCFITILREAFVNIIKHSNATKVEVVLREHPGIYQLLINDNGNVSSDSSSDGIGLINMRDRVLSLNGTISITKDKGFRIFIMIPKLKDKQ